ncbi:MAG: hypothetical protein QW379_09025 [Thermoplasmata archaeon]
MLAAANDTGVGLWRAPELVKHSSAHALEQRFVEWTPDGSHIITGSGSSTLTLWSPGPLREIESIKAGNGTLMALSLPSRGTLGLALLSGGRILIFNQTDLGPVSSIEPADAPSVAAFAPDASFIMA